MWIILFLFLINQLARHPVSEEFIAQRCNLITCSKHIAQIIASHERSELDSRHARRQLKCSGKPSAVAEYPLTDGLEVMWQFDLQEILLLCESEVGDSRRICFRNIQRYEIRHIVAD